LLRAQLADAEAILLLALELRIFGFKRFVYRLGAMLEVPAAKLDLLHVRTGFLA
jgi:hypothetical protein